MERGKAPTRSKVIDTPICCQDIKSCIRKVLCPFKIEKHVEISVECTTWIMNQEVYCKEEVFIEFLEDTYPEIKLIKNLNFSFFCSNHARSSRQN